MYWRICVCGYQRRRVRVYPAAMDTLVLHSEKGGCGKTTLAALLAMAAVRDGRRVTTVDLDPRATLTRLLGVEFEPGYSTDAILAAENPTRWGRQLRVPSPWAPERLFCIPAERGLGNREQHPDSDGENRLAQALKGLPGDLTIVDTPPRPGGHLVRIALALPRARVVWAATPDQDGLDGIANSWATLEHIRATSNRTAAALGIAVTRYDARTTDARRSALDMARIYDGLVLAPSLPERVIVRDARAADEWAGRYSADIRDAADQLWVQLRGRLADPRAPDQLRAAVLERLDTENREGAAE